MKRLVIMSGLVAWMGSMGLAGSTPEEPCQQIKTACIHAGFAKGAEAPKGKKLYKNCVVPIMDGKTVRGVPIDPEVVEACRAHGRTAE